MNKFHYIIAGAGCAGLSLLTRMLQSEQFSGKKILLIDRTPKDTNDRTWCFWEKGEGFFEPVVYKSWQQLWFHAHGHSQLHNIAPYRYKMIRGGDFYKYCFEIIAQHPNVTVQYGEVEWIKEGTLQMNGVLYHAEYIFNSIQFEKPVLKNNQYCLLQHFKGWIIETPTPVFDPQQATLMDFRVPQQSQTAFVYVMPFSPTMALIEYTLFSNKIASDALYENGLKDYIDKFLQVQEYAVLEKESGVIPMTNYPFRAVEGAVINIGTAGGQTKASSGYTFQFIQKQAEQLVNNLKARGTPLPLKQAAGRFRWYDGILLNILYKNKLPGACIFTKLFKHNDPTDILRFLDNETRIAEEWKIISPLPKKIFLKAAWQQLF